MLIVTLPLLNELAPQVQEGLLNLCDQLLAGNAGKRLVKSLHDYGTSMPPALLGTLLDEISSAAFCDYDAAIIARDNANHLLMTQPAAGLDSAQRIGFRQRNRLAEGLARAVLAGYGRQKA